MVEFLALINEHFRSVLLLALAWGVLQRCGALGCLQVGEVRRASVVAAEDQHTTSGDSLHHLLATPESALVSCNSVNPAPPNKYGSTGEECNPAIAFIAIGVTATEPVFLNALTGVAKYADWKHPVFIITDAQECLQAQISQLEDGKVATELDIKYLKVPPPKPFKTWASTHPRHTSDHPSKGEIAKAARRQRMHWVLKEIKVYKMRIFKLLGQHGYNLISHVIFVDADVIVGASMQPLVNLVCPVLTGGSPYSLATFPGNHTASSVHGHEGPRELFHTGLLVIHRDTSTDILQDWEHECLHGPSIRDQSALAVVLQRKRAHHRLFLLPGFHDEFIEKPLIDYLPSQVCAHRVCVACPYGCIPS